MKSSILPQDKRRCSHLRKTRKGFSIVEVAIAMGVVTLLLTTFLGVFGPAQKNIQRALSTKDANRMKDELSKEMSVLRSTEYAATSSPTTGKYKSSFDKAFWMISNSHDEAKAVLMYQYKADPTADPDNDGILDPYTGDNGIPGKDYIVQTAVRALTDTRVVNELSSTSVVGSVFVVRMTELVRNGNALEVSTSAGVTDIADKAVIAFKAEFFRLKSNNYQFISSANWDFEKVGNAITEVNMAIRR